MRSVLFITVGVSLCLCIVQASKGEIGTIYFCDPVQVEAGGVPIDFGYCTVPRLVDWDDDNDLDILVGGAGDVWLFKNSGTSTYPLYDAGTRVQANGIDIQHGTVRIGVCFVDLTGDGLSDLVVQHSQNRICMYENIGSREAPLFDQSIALQNNSGELYMPVHCGGLFDIADWDNDGLYDILAGDFEGDITYFHNDGSLNSPFFREGEYIQYRGAKLHRAYHICPRLFDINRDGLPDLNYGINWAYFGSYINHGTLAEPYLGTHVIFKNLQGNDLSVRDIIDWHTLPDFADLNGDNVVDIISGGGGGNIFVLYGVPHTLFFNRIEQIMQVHPVDLGHILTSDPNVREELFGLHHGMRDFTNDFLVTVSARQQILDWYTGHIGRYPHYLLKQYLDTNIHTYVPHLAGQVWINMFESLPDSTNHRTSIANTIGLEGQYKNMLIDLGVLFIENSCADSGQQNAVYNYLSALPRQLWDAEIITIKGFLGSNVPSEVGMKARTGVNLFSCRVGEYSENSFPADSPQGMIDLFCGCLAHEVNHTVDSHTFGQNRNLLERKYYLIEQAAPPDIIFYDHDIALGMDWNSTKARFEDQGYWDGNPDTWDQSWNDYWATGDGANHNENWLRNNLRLMCQSPQEAFATLANQYFTSSRMMLDLSLSRWNRGITSCINQFLFFVDVYSQGTNKSYFYTIDVNGNIDRTTVCLGRNKDGHINRLSFDQSIYEFSTDDYGNVISPLGPIPYATRIGDITCDFVVDMKDFSSLAASWFLVDCTYCNDSDLNHSGIVDISDLFILFENWLE